jgi:hypothetical protein
MGYKNISRDELENLYSHEGINRKELRYLLRVNPNRITDELSKIFRKELNPFKFPEQHRFTIRGFIHSAPKKLLKVFNSIHYSLIESVGQYTLFILSSSPNELDMAVPIIIPNDIIGKEKISRAHFAEIHGYFHNMDVYDKQSPDALFVVAEQVQLLGFNELFSIVDPVLELQDLYGMIRDRFNTTKLIAESIILWLVSSPGFEARAGGNAFSPISPAEQKYKCDPRLLTDFHNDLLSIPLPYFSKSKSKSCVFNYTSAMKCKLSYHQNSEISYRFEPNLNSANRFLTERKLLNKKSDIELNLSTTNLELDTIKNRPLETFLKKPIIDAKILSQTDLPVLFTTDDLMIEESENELFEYSVEISQLLYQSMLKIPRSPYTLTETAGAVKDLMDDIKNSFYELHELMTYGIIFNPGLIGGIGEHLTRISNSILRMTAQKDEQETFIQSQELFANYINKLTDEFSPYIKAFYYQFEDSRAEQDQLKTHKLRSIVNSILFELNNTYKDGWRYEEFEAEFKKRSGFSKKRTEGVFQKLIGQNDITERSAGLYWRILGFDKFH